MGESLIPLFHFHPLRNIQTFICIFYICDGYLVFGTTTHVITRLLLREIYLPLGISIWLDVKSIFTFDLMFSALGFSKWRCGFELASTIFIELFKRTDYPSELAVVRTRIWTLNQTTRIIMKFFLWMCCYLQNSCHSMG